jgi:hypothetical protein
MLSSLAIAGIAAMAGALGAQAETRPARIILLRHGEKKNSAELCGVGTLRAQALAAQYLGKGAPANGTIYGKGVAPDALFRRHPAYAGDCRAFSAKLGKSAHHFFRPSQRPHGCPGKFYA